MIDEHQRYLGCLGLLCECSVHLSEGPDSRELRASMAQALDDAKDAGAIDGWKRVLNRFEILEGRSNGSTNLISRN